MGQVISLKPGTLFVQRTLMVCFFLLWGLTLEDGRGTGTFSASAGLAFRYKLDRKKEDSMNLKNA